MNRLEKLDLAGYRKTGELSVVIPAWQAESYLAQAVASVRTQDWPGGMEVVIVDDGSTDGTLAVARTCGDIIITQPRGGAAKARNAGLRASSGEWVLLLDADDMLTDGALAALYAPFRTRPELAAVFGRAEDFISPELSQEQKDILLTRPESYFGVLSGCALIRKQTFEKVGLFDETLWTGETVAWRLKLQDKKLPIEKIDYVTLWRRLHLNNTGKVSRQQEMLSYAAILRKRMREN